MTGTGPDSDGNDREPRGRYGVFDLHPAAVYLILNKVGVNVSWCKECGHEEIPYFYTPDREHGTVPRIPSLGVTDGGMVSFSPSNYLAMCYLTCRNCGYVRMYNAYALLAQAESLDIMIEGNNARIR